MVVSSEGLFYVYSIDLENGGECILTKSHNLLEGLDSFDNQSTLRDDSTTAPSSISLVQTPPSRDAKGNDDFAIPKESWPADFATTP